ncbi:MAG: CapA family protein [Desulfovibrio sp.]|nr:CapA family protein [Desulfovibrio sp.]
MNTLSVLAAGLRPLFLCQVRGRVGTLFLAASDMQTRAVTRHAVNLCAEEAWDCALDKLAKALEGKKPCILRADWEVERKVLSFAQFVQQVEQTRRNYFRFGLLLDLSGQMALSDMELNANAMLYRSGDNPYGQLNVKNCEAYLARRFGCGWPDFSPESQVALLTLQGAFVSDSEAHLLLGQGLHQGRRDLGRHRPECFLDCARNASRYLARQCHEDGRFDYGCFSCFDRAIPTYNTLRHISSIWSMLCAYQAFREKETRQAIVRATDYCVQHFLRQNNDCSYFEDVESGELKLGSNGCALIMLSLYTELIHKKKYLPLMRSLARGIVSMQQEDGSFVHVLSSHDFSLKERTRIVYYDGEAVFGLLRLYALIHEDWLLAAARRAFDYFIANRHWRNHDHWLSYAVNEITRVLPEEQYFLFGIQNVQGYLDFIKNRETAYPTLLELMLAAHAMLKRLAALPFGPKLLAQIDRKAFDEALRCRAEHLLNAHFWPELAMFFKKPQRILGSFFIKHHAFRVRIDDVQHFLSAFIGYAQLLAEQGPDVVLSATSELLFGGRVQLGRRMHWKARLRNPLAELLRHWPKTLKVLALGSLCASLGEESTSLQYVRARPEQLNLLSGASCDLVLLANEQALAFGPEGLNEELGYLRMAGIRQAGAGQSQKQAANPVYLSCARLTVAILALDLTETCEAAGSGPLIWSLPAKTPRLWRDELAGAIARARESAQLVFLAVNWGDPEDERVPEWQRDLGHLLIDLGCDAVLGACGRLKGLENYHNRPILYDAGKLLFDDLEGEASGGVFTFALEASGVRSVTFWPLALGYGQTRPVAGAKAQAMLCHYQALCGDLQTQPARLDDQRLRFDFVLPARNTSVRPVWPEKLAQYTVPELSFAPKAYQVQAVPEEARIIPYPLGPLTLLGLRIPEQWQDSEPLCLESWWQLNTATDLDLVFQYRGKSLHMPKISFGAGTSHSGCNFLFPTSRWKEGVIYRDVCLVPVPDSFRLIEDEIVWRVSLQGKDVVFGPYELEPRTSVALKPRPFYRTDFPKDCLLQPQSLCWDSDQLATLCAGQWLGALSKPFSVASLITSLGYLPYVPKPALFVASDYAHSAKHLRLDPKAGSWDSHKILSRNWQKFVGAIVEHPVEGVPEDFPQLVVDDGMQKLIELGIAARQRFQGKVIGITGSVGKTTCCEMLRQTLAQDARVGASYASHNNRIGVASCFASIPADFDYAVLEMAIPAFDMLGGSVSGYLTPHVAWVTQIAEAHLDQWKDLETVARLKSRIFEGMEAGCVAVINRDMPFADYFARRAREHGLQIIDYGSGEDCRIRLLAFETGTMRVSVDTKVYTLHPAMAGSHTAMNILGVLAVLLALDRSIERYLETISGFSAVSGRGNILHGVFGGKSITVIDESYNACPASMRAALTMLRQTQTPHDVLLLGDMLALGEKAVALHLALVEDIVQAQPERVFLCGQQMAKVWEKLDGRLPGRWFQDVEAVCQGLGDLLADGDRVLVKASHGTELGKFVRAVRKKEPEGS